MRKSMLYAIRYKQSGTSNQVQNAVCYELRAQNCRFKQTRFSVLLYYNNALIAVQVR